MNMFNYIKGMISALYLRDNGNCFTPQYILLSEIFQYLKIYRDIYLFVK